MRKCVKILNMRYFDYDGNEITIGGVQTYITNLAKVAFTLGMSVEVFQFASRDFSSIYQGVEVHGVGMDLDQDLSKKSALLYKKAMKSFDFDNDILIFATDIIVPRFKCPFAIAIQHGIGWDVESESPCSRLENIVYSLRQFRRSIVITRHAKNVKKLIN